MRIKHYDYLQSGAAIIESCLVLVPLLLVTALILELTHSQNVRQIAQLALYEAARVGSVTGAHPEKIDQAFSAAILPLFVPAGMHTYPAKRRDASAQTIANETGQSLWKIETLNPAPPVFADFADHDLSRKIGQLVLRNDYLAEQHQIHIRQGWPHGLGPTSGRTVFEANTLRLQLSLIYRPRTPGIAFVLKRLSAGRTDRTGIAWNKGYLVAELITEVMMQSHAQFWSETRQSKPDSAEVPIQIQRPSPSPSPSPSPIRSPSTSRIPSPLSGQAIASETKNESATVNDEAAKENKLCDGLLCC